MSRQSEEAGRFDVVITKKRNRLSVIIPEIVRYRDLIWLFVRRNFVSRYKQTVLGPAWAVIQPLLTTVVLTVIFGNIAGLSPGGIPAFIFYFAGTLVWSYFSQCLTETSSVFTANSHLFGKVYFPRLIMPISTVFSNLISFFIQFVLFSGFLIYYCATGAGVSPNIWMLFTPVLLLHMAMLGMGCGIIVSALTTKYRDLAMIVGFGVQLWMYATPVAYDYTKIIPKYLGIYMLNPMSPIVMVFRYAFLGTGYINWNYYLISVAITLALLFFGIALFNRVEKTFMDTV
ncbi:MAG: ABC transporter permease [Clostridia bacterium]|nr:ABC transporter permease [Clostridia bacterium]